MMKLALPPYPKVYEVEGLDLRLINLNSSVYIGGKRLFISTGFITVYYHVFTMLSRILSEVVFSFIWGRATPVLRKSVLAPIL